ncbi:hypothetical protein [Sphingomonas sp. 28-63-12]|uniref:hypothetical protein n=1 Tax=Sphingomonas sp. 28-63-12 TaxID=1970434 RepID=UPI000BC953B9|nr:MAG: hypothetical protein B7Y47_02980 [Sphingomonas sp. 28-63-12]
MASRAAYPTDAQLQRAIGAARKVGFDVAGVSISREGEIKLFEARALSAQPSDEFERLEAAGLL